MVNKCAPSIGAGGVSVESELFSVRHRWVEESGGGFLLESCASYPVDVACKSW